MSTSRCPRCGRENEAGHVFCLDCGQALAATPRPPAAPAAPAATCASCGARVEPGHRFCGACGKPVGPPPPPAPRVPVVPQGGPALTPIPFSLPRVPPRLSGRIRLALVRNDGQPGQLFDIEKEEAICGRSDGDVRLPDDPTVSPRHARFTIAGGVLRVEDLGSVNGTFLRLKEPRKISVGDEVRVGRQLLRLEPLPRPAQAGDHGARPWGTKDHGARYRLSQLLEGGGLGEIFPLRDGESVVGREAGDVTFPTDRYVSARHARLEVKGAEIVLADVGSSNGTYVKLTGAADLASGDQLLVGAQLLRVE